MSELHQEQLAFYHARENFLLEMKRLSSDHGKTAVKSAMIINGGAAIALLAFVGNIWPEGFVNE